MKMYNPKTRQADLSARERLSKYRRHKRWVRAVSVLAAVMVFVTTYSMILPTLTATRTDLSTADLPKTHTLQTGDILTLSDAIYAKYVLPVDEPETDLDDADADSVDVNDNANANANADAIVDVNASAPHVAIVVNPAADPQDDALLAAAIRDEEGAAKLVDLSMDSQEIACIDRVYVEQYVEDFPAFSAAIMDTMDAVESAALLEEEQTAILRGAVEHTLGVLSGEIEEDSEEATVLDTLEEAIDEAASEETAASMEDETDVTGDAAADAAEATQEEAEAALDEDAAVSDAAEDPASDAEAASDEAAAESADKPADSEAAETIDGSAADDAAASAEGEEASATTDAATGSEQDPAGAADGRREAEALTPSEEDADKTGEATELTDAERLQLEKDAKSAALPITLSRVVDGVTVTAQFARDVLPSGAQLQVHAVDGAEYEELVADATGKNDRVVKPLDIGFVAGGQEVEPDGDVQISFQADFLDEQANPEVIHVTDEGSAEILESTMEDGQLTLTTDSFSVYVIAYTVDFHYEVNGKMYDFSIPGGGFASLEHVIEVLGIADQGVQENFSGEVDVNKGVKVDEKSSEDAPLTLDDVVISDDTRKFVSDVEKVEFSTPELLSVSKVDKDTTVGAIKDGLGLECEYSEDLTEAQIAEINATKVESGDWALISLKPFMSEETLTVTMKNGDSFQIKITDAQISTHVLTASGDTYEITVTYGEDAQIPDGAELKVKEITEAEKEYDKLRQATDKALISKYEEGLAKDENPVTFDIGVYVNGVEIEPADGAEVSVKIWLADSLLETEVVEKEVELTEDLNGLWCNGKILAPDENAPIVVHHLDDGSVEIINEIEAERNKNGETIAFETTSFSAYSIPNNGNSGTGLYLSKDYDSNTTLYVGDEIYYKGTNLQISSGKDTVATLFEENGEYKVVRLINPGSFTIIYRDGNMNRTITRNVQAYPSFDTSNVPVCSTVTNEEAGISLNLFDYDIDGILNHSWNGDNTDSRAWYTEQGINKDHKLKFWTQCPGYNEPYNNGWNWAADQTAPLRNGNFPTTNIVSDKLGTDKYPVISNTTESLNYLFDPDEETADRNVYRNADKLFKYEDGYYIYDSTKNYAYYDPTQEDNGKFVVYDTTYQYDNADLQQNGTPIGFFPFHEYNSAYEQTLPTISGHQQMNHHFGISMSAKFAIPNGGKDSYGQNIKYEFSGDDDMWVFIDDDLALDLGGIHQPVKGVIDFSKIDQGIAEVTVTSINLGNVIETKQITGLQANKEYTLRSFYLERGGGDSNCKIMFNLPTYRTLKLAKRLNGLSEKEYEKYKNEWFTYELVMKTGTDNDFTLYKTPDEARKSATNPEPNYDLRPLVRDENGDIIGAVLDDNGNATKDEHGNYITKNLGKTETADNKAQARWLIVDNGQIKLKDGWVVEIPHLSRSDSFYVAEEKTINMDEFEKPHAEREFFTNSDGEHHEEEIDLTDSTTQAQNPDEHKQLADWKTGNMTLQETEKVTFTNTLKEKNLIVKKKWSDGNENHTDDSITFQVIAEIKKQDGTEGLYSQLHADEHNIWGKVTGKLDENGDKVDPGEDEILQHEYTLSRANDWEMMFEHLPAVTEDDEVITYSVVEKKGKPGYTSGDPTVTAKTIVDVFKYFPDNSYPSETIGFYLKKDGKYYTGKAEPNAWSDTTAGAKEYTLRKSTIQDESYHCRFYDMPAGTYDVEPVAADDSNPLTKGLAIHQRPVKEFEIFNEKGSVSTTKKWVDKDGKDAGWLANVEFTLLKKTVIKEEGKEDTVKYEIVKIPGYYRERTDEWKNPITADSEHRTVNWEHLDDLSDNESYVIIESGITVLDRSKDELSGVVKDSESGAITSFTLNGKSYSVTESNGTIINAEQDLTSITVKKEWAGDITTGSATMALYRTEVKIDENGQPLDESLENLPTDSFAITINADLKNEEGQSVTVPAKTASIHVLVKNSKNEVVKELDLNNSQGWTGRTVTLKRGEVYSIEYGNPVVVSDLSPTKEENIISSGNHTVSAKAEQVAKYSASVNLSNIPQGINAEKGTITLTLTGSDGTTQTAEFKKDSWGEKSLELTQGETYSYEVSIDGKYVTGKTITADNLENVTGNKSITITPTFADLAVDVPVSINWGNSTPESGTKITVRFADPNNTANNASIQLDGSENPTAWNGKVELSRWDENGNPIIYNVTAESNKSDVSLEGAPTTVTEGGSVSLTGSVSKGMAVTFKKPASPEWNWGSFTLNVYDATNQWNKISTEVWRQSFGQTETQVKTSELDISDSKNKQYVFGFYLPYVYNSTTYQNDRPAVKITTNSKTASLTELTDPYDSNHYYVTFTEQPGDVEFRFEVLTTSDTTQLNKVASFGTSGVKPAPARKKLSGGNNALYAAGTASDEHVFYDPSFDGSGTEFSSIAFKDLPDEAQLVSTNILENSVLKENPTTITSGEKTWTNLPATGFASDGSGAKVKYYYFVVEKDATAKADTMDVSYSYEYYENSDGDKAPENGIKKVTIVNTTTGTPEPETKPFKFHKIWHDLSQQDTTWVKAITITLYSRTGNSAAGVSVGTFTLSESGLSSGDYIWIAESSNDGKKTTFSITNLPAKDSSGNDLEYYVVEGTVEGYNASYQLSTGGTKTNDNYALNDEIIVNSPVGGYELPSTGGSGTTLLTLLGSVLVMLSCIGLILWRRRRFNA